MARSLVGEAVKEQVWFKKAQEVCKQLDKLQESKRIIQSLTDEDLASVFKPPDHVVQVISVTFVLLGERQAELKVSIPCSMYTVSISSKYNILCKHLSCNLRTLYLPLLSVTNTSLTLLLTFEPPPHQTQKYSKKNLI